ncbi:hypothetical protein BASA50_006515 [Batrachochytrium salamandrivorans]|uniref:Uncharacterized protein n=1 Tax=Batrachochytrium salamandrivorans TaxID=1357716 RepID=A0ABQ8F9P3_9FUNG|nr:hypothetical protein BASA50_006515 [Batrachochytrium salamandrivorans]
MTTTGPVDLVEYLNKYVVSCEKMCISPVMAVKKTVGQAIDSGEIPDMMKLNGTITELRYRRIDDDIVESIFLPMVGMSLFRYIDLSYNEIGNRGAFALAKVLKDDAAIEVLILRSNNISSEGVISITKSLTYNEKLAHLDLSENPIGDEGGMAIASLLQINANIFNLNLSGCSLGATSLIGLSTVLQSNNSVVNLDLSNNIPSISSRTQTLMNDVMAHLSKTLQLNYGIKVLNLSKFGITDWIFVHDKLTLEFNLSNKISRDGGIALCNSIMRHSSLNILSLSCCAIQDEGAEALAQVIRNNSKLKEIYIDYNKISSIGLIAIADALKENWAIRFIALWGNQWDEASCKAFSRLMNGPTSSVCVGGSQAPLLVQQNPRSIPPSARLQSSMTDVSFYTVETTIHVAHAPKDRRII